MWSPRLITPTFKCLYVDKSAISVTAAKALFLSRCFADQSLWVINHEMFKEVQTYQVIFGCSDLFESHLRFKTYHSLWWALALCILKELRDLEEIFSIWCLLSLVVMKFCFVWSQGMSCSEKKLYIYIKDCNISVCYGASKHFWNWKLFWEAFDR